MENIKRYIVIAFYVLLISCGSNGTSVIELPNGDLITEGKTINDLKNKYSVVYKQYEGFVGNYNDTVLGDFNLLFKNYQNKVGSDVLSKKSILNLENEEVTGISFGKIPTTQISISALVDYLKKNYANAVEEKMDEAIKIIDSRTGKTICIVNYIKLGVPGCFVEFEF
ncbi:MAG: hypothetical protein K8S00_07360 [Bacteroidales bacterium]|nr:hypothetical protein [Bacteroidales bacterium]